jgi:hypothetical protein
MVLQDMDIDLLLGQAPVVEPGAAGKTGPADF